MKILRRVTLFLLGLLLVVVLTVFLLSPQSIISWAGSVSELSPVVRVVLMVLLDAALVTLLILQMRPEPKLRSTGLMMKSSGAIAEVSVESARSRILKIVGDVPDVVSVAAEVKPIHGKADIELDVEVVGQDVRLPSKQDEINRALKQVINKQLGLQMAGRPRVHIRIHGEEVAQPPVMPAIPPVRVEEPARPLPPVVPPVAPLVEPVRVEPVLEAEPDLVRDEAPAPVETTPEPQPKTGLFSGLRRPSEPEVKEPVVTPPLTEVEKPVASPVQPELESKSSSGLFGIFRRAAEPEKPEPEDDPFGDTPELAALLRKQPATPPPPEAIEPVTVVDDEALVEDDEDADDLILDFDKEVASSATDDIVDESDLETEVEDDEPSLSDKASPDEDQARPSLW